MKITEMKGASLLPVRIDCDCRFTKCDKSCFNSAVTQLEKCSVEVEIEELGRWIEGAMMRRRQFIESYPSRKGRKGQNIPPIPKLGVFVAQELSKCKQNWLRLEVGK